MSAKVSPKIAVIGAGSWGSALAKLLAERHADVVLWCRDANLTHTIRKTRTNPVYLPDVLFPQTLAVTTDLEQALRDATWIFWVVPSHAFRQMLKTSRPYLESNALHICCAKGIETDSLMLMSDVFEQEFNGQQSRFLALGGPSFSREVSLGHPTAVCVACIDAQHAQYAQQLISSELFRVYTSDDVVGVELGGALKNVIALAAGAAIGLGFEHNAVSALITRGLGEMTRLAIKKGASHQTLAGLSGMGDLVLTCTGTLSRNRYVGIELGKGRALSDILAEMKMVAEGVRTARSVYQIMRKEDLELPIFSEIYSVLYQDKPVRQALHSLMSRALKREFEA